MKADDQRARVLPDRIGPDDPRYTTLVARGFNKRFAGKPDYVRLVHSTDEVIDAVRDAVREGRRVVARGGGHCLEGFVDDPDVRVIIDTSLMTSVRHDPDMRAFAIDSGTTLGEVYRRLFLDWGVTLPAGESRISGSAPTYQAVGLLVSALQRVKRRWDPRYVFHHALSIRP